MVLHSVRKRRAQRNEQEANGHDLWSDEIPAASRIAISAAWETIESNFSQYLPIAREVSAVMRRAGVPVPGAVYSDYILQSDVSSDRVLDCIGALCSVLSDSRYQRGRDYSVTLAKFINEQFEDHRVAFRLVDGDVVPFESDELHQEVIVPALRLLVGDRFTKAHEAYLEALRELASSPPNAITDAGTALQETLVALGCRGNALGPLIADAKKTGLLGNHDSTLTKALEGFLDWASANRSTRGDGHQVSSAKREDAWLMIHIVGSLIVYLTRASARAQ